MKVCGPSFFSLRTIVWMFEKYYLNKQEENCEVDNKIFYILTCY